MTSLEVANIWWKDWSMSLADAAAWATENDQANPAYTEQDVIDAGV